MSVVFLSRLIDNPMQECMDAAIDPGAPLTSSYSPSQYLLDIDFDNAGSGAIVNFYRRPEGSADIDFNGEEGRVNPQDMAELPVIEMWEIIQENPGMVERQVAQNMNKFAENNADLYGSPEAAKAAYIENLKGINAEADINDGVMSIALKSYILANIDRIQEISEQPSELVPFNFKVTTEADGTFDYHITDMYGRGNAYLPIDMTKEDLVAELVKNDPETAAQYAKGIIHELDQRDGVAYTDIPNAIDNDPSLQSFPPEFTALIKDEHAKGLAQLENENRLTADGEASLNPIEKTGEPETKAENEGAINTPPENKIIQIKVLKRVYTRLVRPWEKHGLKEKERN